MQRHGDKNKLDKYFLGYEQGPSDERDTMRLLAGVTGWPGAKEKLRTEPGTEFVVGYQGNGSSLCRAHEFGIAVATSSESLKMAEVRKDVDSIGTALHNPATTQYDLPPPPWTPPR